MDKLVLTIAVGGAYLQMASHTHPSIKAYAEKIGADFLCIDESDTTSPHWEKFQIFNLLNKYKRILYLDSDLIIRDDCPDLFEIVPDSQLGMFNEAPFTDGRQMSIYEVCQAYETTLPNWNGKYYNSGVMVISRCHKYLFKKPDKEVFNFYEQGYLNLIIAKNEVEMYELRYHFNRMTCMDQLTGEERHASYIIHYAGYPSLEFVNDIIPKDIAKWETDSPEYKYKRHIIVNVQGGLGDQVDAEPSIRFMKEQVYKDDEIIIWTHFPRLFAHLGLPTYEHGAFIPEPDTPYHVRLSLPGPDKIQWSIVSNLMCHTVDYCAMALLIRTLPLKDRQIQLAVDMNDIANLMEVIGIRNLNELVLVHPGRHWESKTFPVEWWQEVVDGLASKGLPVCLIGKEDGNRGTVQIDVPDNVIDTRDLLDLGSLIALISQARVLLSNDSAPIHIAGAFDNEIILIPTCKHPDHLLPYRNGSITHKATALYQRLTLDDCKQQPTEMYDASGEFVNGDILDYLPEPEDVIQTTIERYS